MQLIKCSIDDVRPKEKPSTLFWAWIDIDNQRHGFRQRLCLEHFLANVAPFLVDEQEGDIHCPGCHIDIEDEYWVTWCTAFLPGRGREDLQIPTCAPCGTEIRRRAMVGSTELPDKKDGAGSPAPSYSAWETLADLGRTP